VRATANSSPNEGSHASAPSAITTLSVSAVFTAVAVAVAVAVVVAVAVAVATFPLADLVDLADLGVLAGSTVTDSTVIPGAFTALVVFFPLVADGFLVLDAGMLYLQVSLRF
jgi:hypothetical protein